MLPVAHAVRAAAAQPVLDGVEQLRARGQPPVLVRDGAAQARGQRQAQRGQVRRAPPRRRRLRQRAQRQQRERRRQQRRRAADRTCRTNIPIKFNKRN